MRSEKLRVEKRYSIGSLRLRWKVTGFALCFALGCIALGCQPASEAPTSTTPATPEPLPAQRATAGVGKQGEKLLAHNQVQKIISGPASQSFQVRERAIFDIQIPHALQLYKASNGRAPQSHEDFVKNVLEPNKLVLPELRDGLVYRFNVEAEELWVYPEEEVTQTP